MLPIQDKLSIQVKATPQGLCIVIGIVHNNIMSLENSIPLQLTAVKLRGKFEGDR